MEEILASIRRIIADDESAKPAGAPEATAGVIPMKPSSAKPASAPPAEPAAISQNDIDAMLAGFESGTEADAPDAGPEPHAEAAMPGPQSDTAVAAETADVLELTEAMEADEEPEPEFRTIDPVSDVVFADSQSEPPATSAQPTQATGPAFSEFEAESLLSEETTAAAATAFGALAHTVLTKNARTLEDLVGEMLRPMLKNWLDNNLPTIVERLVRAEIERVSRGRS
ncbi:MAG: PopZ family protein [Variibacter sp.]